MKYFYMKQVLLYGISVLKLFSNLRETISPYLKPA